MKTTLNIGDLVKEALSHIKQRRFLFIRVNPAKQTELLLRRRKEVIDHMWALKFSDDHSEDPTTLALSLYLCGVDDAIEAFHEENPEKKQRFLLSAEKKFQSARFTANK